jgi:hypothetical protein
MTLEDFKGRLANRYVTFELSVQWFKEHRGCIIVETGCVRLEDDWGGAGMSTIVFDHVIQKEKLRLAGTTHLEPKFYSVDLDEKNVSLARNLTKEAEISVGDSVAFLEDFHGSIDLLYLDSYDCDPEGDSTPAQEHQLAEVRASLPKMALHSAILLDDRGDPPFPGGGKTRLSEEYLRDKGWVSLWTGYQSLWVR